MPLIKSKSDKAFKSNIAAEVKAGKPPKQAVAIAYSVKNAANKASGGSMDDDRMPSRSSEYKKAKSSERDYGRFQAAEMGKGDKKEYGRTNRRNESERLKESAERHSSIGDPVHDLIANLERKNWSQKIGGGKPAPFKDGGRPGLYANINAKKERIKHEKAAGLPVERMRKVGSKGAPTADAFKQSAKTARMKDGGMTEPYDSNRRDLLLRRDSINFVNKVPRQGQTNFRQIPTANDPTAPNYQKPESKAYMEDLRKRAPSILKTMIKEDLGTHRTPKLPKKSGGKVNKSCW